MTELMIKMTSWLVAAMALGFIVSWLLSRIIYKKKEAYKVDSLSAVLLERNNMIEKLEKSFRNEKIMLGKVSADLIDAEKLLSEKTSLVTTLHHRLENSNLNKTDTLVLQEKNNLLATEIQKLKQLDRKRVDELRGFEEVLFLAEERMEENEKNYRQVVKQLDNDIEVLTVQNEKHKRNKKLYESTINDFKESLKLYKADTSEPEFIISKDQFVKIEEQLVIYQKEIENLKSENDKLLLKFKKSDKELRLEADSLEDKMIEELNKENDDGSMVKAFRETYKKITKS